MKKRIGLDVGRRVLLRTLSVSLIGCCVAIGCDRSSEPSRDNLARSVLSQCASDTRENFFSDEHFWATDQENRLVRAEYSRYLLFLEEPVLSCGEGPDEAYRVTVIHPFQADPVVIRIVRSGGTYGLVGIGSRGNNIPLTVRKRIRKSLGSEQWREMIALIQDVQFWSAPTQPPQEGLILDPSVIIVEGRKGSAYHAVGRPLLQDGFSRIYARLYELAELTE